MSRIDSDGYRDEAGCGGGGGAYLELGIIEEEEGLLLRNIISSEMDEQLALEAQEMRYAQESASERAIKSIRNPNVKKGGSYGSVPKNGGENHHMPAKSVSNLSKNKGPALNMEKADHRMTASWGNSKEAQLYRAQQKSLIDKGKFMEAQQMDIDDVTSKFGSKYNEGIRQMKDYTIQLFKD
ncbi:hypothetical protein [Clostridium manihotivorum]|uniref:hypothetical protein n=1 Tax=Clostridium manihotivorum TaxID=2320868 RepID=UPI001EE5D57A|nr:hypothetical protein [Clostridium manihotivorum]